MATAVTPEHVETQARAGPAAVKPSREEVRKIAIDGNTLSVLAVGVALFALAFGAFTHLSGRIDSVATELRSDIKDVNAKVDKLSAEMNAKMDKLSAEQRAENREINARLDRLFELVASQGSRDPR